MIAREPLKSVVAMTVIIKRFAWETAKLKVRGIIITPIFYIPAFQIQTERILEPSEQDGS